MATYNNSSVHHQAWTHRTSQTNATNMNVVCAECYETLTTICEELRSWEVRNPWLNERYSSSEDSRSTGAETESSERPDADHDIENSTMAGQGGGRTGGMYHGNDDEDDQEEDDDDEDYAPSEIEEHEKREAESSSSGEMEADDVDTLNQAVLDEELAGLVHELTHEISAQILDTISATCFFCACAWAYFFDRFPKVKSFIRVQNAGTTMVYRGRSKILLLANAQCLRVTFELIGYDKISLPEGFPVNAQVEYHLALREGKHILSQSPAQNVMVDIISSYLERAG